MIRSTPRPSRRSFLALEVAQRDVIGGEPSGQGSPLGGHVADGKARIHAQSGYPGAVELHHGVEDLTLVVEATEGDDDVLPRGPWRELPFQNDLHGPGNLPPKFPRRPNCRRIGPHHRGPQGPQGAIHVGVGVGGHHQGAREPHTPWRP